METAYDIFTSHTERSGFPTPTADSGMCPETPCVQCCYEPGIPSLAPVLHAPAHGNGIPLTAAQSASGLARCATVFNPNPPYNVLLPLNKFAYNTRSELTNAVYSSYVFLNNTYSYDNIGNPTEINANKLNQENYNGFDIDGNEVGATGHIRYDSANRLVSMLGQQNVVIITNVYDHASRRVYKRNTSYEYTCVYDGWNLIAEIEKSLYYGTCVTNLFVWGKDLSGSMQGAGGVGGLLATRVNGVWYFPLYDNNGNITEYINENGTVAGAYSYDAFGKMQNGSTWNFRHFFSTKYYDNDTLTYYFGYRHYIPALRRFLNRDPIEESGGLNLYAFCGNDAVNRWDYLGEFTPLSMILGSLVSVGCGYGISIVTGTPYTWKELVIDAAVGAVVPGGMLKNAKKLSHLRHCISLKGEAKFIQKEIVRLSQNPNVVSHPSFPQLVELQHYLKHEGMFKLEATINGDRKKLIIWVGYQVSKPVVKLHLKKGVNQASRTQEKNLSFTYYTKGDGNYNINLSEDDWHETDSENWESIIYE